MQNLKYDANELIYKTETDSAKEQTCGCQGWRIGKGWMGIWGEEMQTCVYRRDKQQDSIL